MKNCVGMLLAGGEGKRLGVINEKSCETGSTFWW